MAASALTAALLLPLRFWRSMRWAACRRPSLRSTCTSSSCSHRNTRSGCSGAVYVLAPLEGLRGTACHHALRFAPAPITRFSANHSQWVATEDGRCSSTWCTACLRDGLEPGNDVLILRGIEVGDAALDAGATVQLAPLTTRNRSE